MTETPQQRIERLAEHWDTHEAVTGNGELLTEPETQEPMIVFSLRLPKGVADQLRVAAETRDLKATELAREWICQRLSHPSEHNPSADTVAGQLERLAAQLRAS